jgi:calcium permeable stress-gated cation channel
VLDINSNVLLRGSKPKTYLVPERERTEPPPSSPWGLFIALFQFRDREIINKCGLDSYFFLRYLQTLLIIFIPMAAIIIPILVPLNYVDGRSHQFNTNATNNGTDDNLATDNLNNTISGLDTLAWGNVKNENYRRYWAHLVLAILVVVWVCGVFFAELRVYIKVRQDWLTTAEHRLRASATTVLVSGIPDKWLSEEALRGLFDVFPGGLRNVWLTRDLTHLLDKITKRDEIHDQLEAAQTELIRMAKRKQLKRREAEEKQARKASKAQGLTKEEKLERQRQEDAAAKQQAEEGQGVSSGDQHEVPRNIDDAEGEVQHHKEQDETTFKGLKAKSGFSKITGGLGKGVDGLLGGARNITQDIDGRIETTNGFVAIGASQGPSVVRTSHDRRVRHSDEEFPRPSTQQSGRHKLSEADERVMGTSATRPKHSRNASVVSDDEMLNKESIEMRQFGNTTRRLENIDEMYNNEKARWYQFWKPPAGGYASPVPQGQADGEFPFQEKKTFGQKFKSVIPFMGGEEIAPVEYSKAYDDEKMEDQDGKAEWEKWVKRSDRPTHRLARFDWTPGWLPGLPFLNKKVDTIFWCRKELARLNHEIETDQANPERYPLMRSAFIQFNHQVAAHMACQSVIHHVPKHMAPRTVEISPNDVIWDNMAISWWSEWLRTTISIGVVIGMIILWAFPVGFTGSISQLDGLVRTFPWLRALAKNATVWKVATAIAGVLPAVLLALLLWLVPVVMEFLAGFKGAKTGTQKTETVQQFYFAFLFVQVFLIVSLASGAIAIIEDVLKDPTKITNTVASKLPSAANYFFSYMILQSLSVSSGTLLQIGALVNWYIISRIFNSTARSKWTTNTTLPQVKWGSYFPVYTNFACIALVYSIIAPIISIFAIITFSLLWIANRYSMLYVNRLSVDTGGVLYPRALNQTFTGLYVMELALIGLFFIQTDEHKVHVCTSQAIIMIVVLILTALYQLLLNRSFGPMFRYLPITFEDEAVLRDEAFQRVQDRRLGLLDEEEEDAQQYKDESRPSRSDHPSADGPSDGQAEVNRGTTRVTFNPVRGIARAGTWAVRGGKTTYNQTLGRAEKGIKNAAKFREERRQKDLEAQRAIGEALYGGFHDDIEDLTPDERDVLVRRAFMHSALRARRPTLWIPRDDLGVSDDEIRRTRDFSEHIWISNEGTALDSKVRVVYGRAPPDFSELDIIQL